MPSAELKASENLLLVGLAGQESEVQSTEMFFCAAQIDESLIMEILWSEKIISNESDVPYVRSFPATFML